MAMTDSEKKRQLVAALKASLEGGESTAWVREAWKEAGLYHRSKRTRFKPSSKLTPEKIAEFAELVKAGNYEGVAAKMVGWNPASAAQWKGKGRRLAASDKPPRTPAEKACVDLYHATQRAVAESEEVLVSQMRRHSEGDFRATSWLLARRFPERWGFGREKTSEEKTPAPVVVNVDQDPGLLGSVARELLAERDRREAENASDP